MNADQPSAGRFEGRLHILPVRIYYEDTDFTGFVYHANYLRYFERARSDYLRLAGVRHAELLEGESPTAFAVSRINVEFLRPARIDDALTVQTGYDSMKGARILISVAPWRRYSGQGGGRSLLHWPHRSAQEAAGAAVRTA
jgi:acyl-CoA thioester hydrolase